MTNDLRAAKTRVRASFLGRFGIHAVGMSRSEQAVKVYLAPGAPGDDSLITQLRELVEPFDVVLIREEGASVTAGIRAKHLQKDG